MTKFTSLWTVIIVFIGLNVNLHADVSTSKYGLSYWQDQVNKAKQEGRNLNSVFYIMLEEAATDETGYIEKILRLHGPDLFHSKAKEKFRKRHFKKRFIHLIQWHDLESFEKIYAINGEALEKLLARICSKLSHMYTADETYQSTLKRVLKTYALAWKWHHKKYRERLITTIKAIDFNIGPKTTSLPKIKSQFIAQGNPISPEGGIGNNLLGNGRFAYHKPSQTLAYGNLFDFFFMKLNFKNKSESEMLMPISRWFHLDDELLKPIFTHNGKMIASIVNPSWVKLIWWEDLEERDLEEKKSAFAFLDSRELIKSLIFNASDNMLIAGTDKKIYFLDTKKMKKDRGGKAFQFQIAQPLNITMSTLTTLALSRDEKILIGGCEDGSLNVWNIADLKRIESIGQPIHHHQSYINTLAFSPNGKLLVSASNDSIRLWQINTSKPAMEPIGEPLMKGDFHSVAFSPNGNILAAGTEKFIHFWDISDIMNIRKFESLAKHSNAKNHYIEHLVFTDNSHLISSTSQSIRFWIKRDR